MSKVSRGPSEAEAEYGRKWAPDEPQSCRELRQELRSKSEFIDEVQKARNLSHRAQIDLQSYKFPWHNRFPVN